MPRIMVDQVHPVHVVPEAGHSQVVKNLGKVNVYYKDTTFVPNTKNELEPTEGTELAEGSEVTIEKFSGLWFLAGVEAGEPPKTKAEATIELKAPTALVSIGESEIAAEAVTASKIGAEAVTTAKIKKEAVTVAKALAPTLPVSSGTESLTATMGTAGTSSIIGVYCCKKEASAKVKVKHALGSEAVSVTAYLSAAKKPTTKLEPGAATAGAIASVKNESAEEVLVTLVAAEPAAGKEEFFYLVQR